MSSSFEKDFCGTAFWDENVTWYTETPDFTPCFHKTILAWTPSVFLIIGSIRELGQYYKSENRHIHWNWLNKVKILLIVSLAILSLSEIILAAVVEADEDKLTDIYPVDYVTAIIYFLSYLWSLFLLLMSLKHGVMTSPTQFFFYLASAICGAITLRSVIMRKLDDDDLMYSQASTDLLVEVYSIQYGLIVSLFVLNLFADAEPVKYNEKIRMLKNPCPQIKASFFSKLIYTWATPLLWKGFRQPLVRENLWDVDPKITSSGIVPLFDQHLDPVMAHAKIAQGQVGNMSSTKIGKNSGTLTFKTEEEEKKGKAFSIFPSMVSTFGPTFFVGSAMKIVYDCMAMASPQIMKLMITFVETNGNKTAAIEMGIQPEESWKGYFYAALLLIVTTIQSILLSQYFERMFIVGMNLRTALISAIYRKSLRMTGAARKESTVGEIVNLMSVDVQRFMDLLPYLNMLWSAPLQIGLSSYFMYQELGPAVFAGVAIMVLAIPINALVAGISRKYQLEQMQNKDKRVKLMNELLGGVKVLKLYGWEPSFINQVLGIRDNEIRVLKKSAWLNAIMTFIWTSVPFMVALASFATYVFMDENNVLDAQKAFVTLSYLNIMRMPMAVLPFLIIGLVQAGVSLDRVNKFMNNAELDEAAVEHNANEKDPIVIDNGTFRWAADEPVVLEDIGVRVKAGSLTAVVGTVGSGKSSLVSALLGEMEKQCGTVNVVGSIAYVPQQAWMQNATVKNNILFGKVHNRRVYDDILAACALKSDLAILPGGDQTEIGEKGINLSGGQKQRVSLARAVYSDSDLYLLDDPLSAVDSHVGKHIFDEVISHEGLLANKTRLLVTHGITYLPRTDHIIVLKNGKVSEQGSYQELVERKGDFADFLLEYMTEMEDDVDLEDLEDIKHNLEEALGKSEFQRQVSQRKESVTRKDSFHRQDSVLSEHSSTVPKIDRDRKQSVIEEEPDGGVEQKEEKIGTTLIDKETVETGSVSLKVYMYYIRNVGLVGALLGVLMQLVYQGSSLGTNFWLNLWTASAYGNSSIPKYRDLYLGVYGAFGFGQAASTMVLALTLAVTTLNASRLMHKTMLDRVLAAPMSFFDTTPLGRIVNRFAKDCDVCDNTLPMNLRQWLNTFANFVGTIILIIVIVPLFAAVIVPVAFVFFFVQKIYVNTSRQLKRLESVSRSPIYSHFGETLNGASTIRAFGLQNQFIHESENQVDRNQICYYPSIIANRWLAIRLETIGNLVTFCAALFAILDPSSVDPSEVGLIVTYAINVTQVLNWLVRMTSDVETNIVAVERIQEYSLIEQEASWASNRPPGKDWPETGSLAFQNYGMRYRPGLDLVLKSISCDIKGGEKVGIVGRTGAGKSSLTVALFRLVEPAQGSITIDGRDVAELGLHELRTKLTIIPQDPVLFSGTLRINLDPFEYHSDEQVWNALKLAHLHEYVTSLEAGLQHDIAEGGENLSVGQRQLVCLARALLRKTKVLILDEATAAVDLETDDLIQATIRSEFKESTVLTIAHRLNTILDYDRIMVLDKGVIAEFDSPDNLLGDKSTIFHSMAKDAGLA